MSDENCTLKFWNFKYNEEKFNDLMSKCRREIVDINSVKFD